VRTEQGQLHPGDDDVEELLASIRKNSAVKGALEGELEVLRGRINELRHKEVPEAQRLGLLREPVFTELAPIGTAPLEKQWLQEVQKGLDDAGYFFHPRLLNAFHTSLKIANYAPLLILAGISGTGKSELPRLYADLGGLSFLPLAVQPSWDSPMDLFGFFNYTEGRLKAEKLSRLLHQVNRREDPLHSGLSMVLLDEMNLARVEYYFSELLSRLEARRGVSEDDTPDILERASVMLPAGPSQQEIPLFLSQRVLFLGTMNEDESTLSLSDKVLDRACVLTFPAPEGMSLTHQTSPPRRRERLAWASWSSWITPSTADDERTETLNAVNEIMRALDRPFGHRLFRAIHAYIANYPGEDKDAWSDQFAMKILPRLKGLECQARRVEDGLRRLGNHVPEDLRVAYEQACREELFAWRGAADLYRVER